jgi:glyoxylase-like metal-dependent hydrolase (beta-lactamase superfamily II)
MKPHSETAIGGKGMEIIPNIHQIKDQFVNAYLIVNGDDLILIDTGFADDAKSVYAKVEELGFMLSDIKKILITHTDKDHVGGLAALKKATNATIYASAGEAQAIQKGELSRPLVGKGLMKLVYFLTQSFSKFTPVEIDEIVSAGQALPILGGLTVVSCPGHTPDHIAFFLKTQGVLFAGDALRASNQGLVISSGGNTWDEAKAIESARTLAALKPEIVCCGHGPVVFDAADKIPVK